MFHPSQSNCQRIRCHQKQEIGGRRPIGCKVKREYTALLAWCGCRVKPVDSPPTPSGLTASVVVQEAEWSLCFLAFVCFRTATRSVARQALGLLALPGL